MFNPIKLYKHASGPMKLVALGFLAMELAALPAAAQIIHRVAFEVAPTVHAVEIPNDEAGVSRFIVTSNAGFGVTAQSVIGDVDINVQQSGSLVDGVGFYGSAAQLPGAATACATVQNGLGAAIYLAERKTAARPGAVVDQAVVFELRYDTAAEPVFTFVAGDGEVAQPRRCERIVG